jgi:hypothetical protein
VELLRDLFDFPISVGTIHNRLQFAADKATAINRSQDLSAIRVGLLWRNLPGGTTRPGGSRCGLNILLSASGG